MYVPCKVLGRPYEQGCPSSCTRIILVSCVSHSRRRILHLEHALYQILFAVKDDIIGKFGLVLINLIGKKC